MQGRNAGKRKIILESDSEEDLKGAATKTQKTPGKLIVLVQNSFHTSPKLWSGSSRGLYEKAAHIVSGPAVSVRRG
jgi:hypothetical protein